MKRRHLLLLLGAMVVGLLVRLPGVLWGYNFPAGWAFHHSDEYPHWVNAEVLIDPSTPARWYHPYPKGTAAGVAVPMIAMRALRGEIQDPPPGIIEIIVLGRIISAFYGAATVGIVFLLTRRLFRDIRIALVSSWIMALGGLHVSQSHFFVADIPGLFWFLLGSFLLILDIEEQDKAYSPYLMGASLCFGLAFGIKLVLVGLPTLGIITLWRKPRILRAVYAAVFFVFAFIAVNLFAYNLSDIFRTFTQGISDPYLWNWWDNLFLHIVEMPSLASLPLLALAIAGSIVLLRKYIRMEKGNRFWAITLVVLLPNLLNAYLVIFQLDHFPRHMIPFIPWMAITAAWCLVAIGDQLKTRRLSPALIYVPVILYLALFVFDGERVFIQEPRNRAAKWLMMNLPPGGSYSWREHDIFSGYKHIYYPYDGKPDVVIIDLHHANHYLSGMGLKNSFPKDHRYIFEGRSQEVIDQLQGLFKGTTEYREVARYKEGYLMPEYIFVDRLIGDRSRNYVAEVVVFSK